MWQGQRHGHWNRGERVFHKGDFKYLILISSMKSLDTATRSSGISRSVATVLILRALESFIRLCNGSKKSDTSRRPPRTGRKSIRSPKRGRLF